MNNIIESNEMLRAKAYLKRESNTRLNRIIDYNTWLRLTLTLKQNDRPSLSCAFLIYFLSVNLYMNEKYYIPACRGFSNFKQFG